MSNEVSILVSAKDGATRVLAGIEGRLRSFSSGLSKLAGFGVAGFTIGAGLHALVGTMRELGDIADQSDNLGVTTDALQALKFAGISTGNSMDQMVAALGKVKSAQAEVGNNAKTREAVERLGIAWQTFARAKPEDAVAMLGKSLRDAKDPTQAFADVGAILGERVGVRMNAALREVAGDGLDSYIAKVREAGAVTSEETVRMADAWDAKMQSITMSVKATAAEAVGYFSKFASLAAAVVTPSRWTEFSMSNGQLDATADIDARYKAEMYRHGQSWLRMYREGKIDEATLRDKLKQAGAIDLMPQAAPVDEIKAKEYSTTSGDATGAVDEYRKAMQEASDAATKLHTDEVNAAAADEAKRMEELADKTRELAEARKQAAEENAQAAAQRLQNAQAMFPELNPNLTLRSAVASREERKKREDEGREDDAKLLKDMARLEKREAHATRLSKKDQDRLNAMRDIVGGRKGVAALEADAKRTAEEAAKLNAKPITDKIEELRKDINTLNTAPNG